MQRPTEAAIPHEPSCLSGAAMSRWLEAVKRAEGAPTKPTEPDKTGSEEVVSVLSVLSQGAEQHNASISDAFGAFEERAVIREHDNGMDRVAAEAEALRDVASVSGFTVIDLERARKQRAL